MIDNVKLLLDQYDYDIRKSRNGRWIDQKCTCDVISSIADFIYEYIESHEKTSFTSKDIWMSDYAVTNVENVFKKPTPTMSDARNEYDKFFQQPMELMAYAGILRKQKKGRKNYYTVTNDEILKYLALAEKNVLRFLDQYITKVLSDSGIVGIFDKFFKRQDVASFTSLKEQYTDFMIRYTPINGKVECGRIFTKVLNPLAFTKSKLGTISGRISKDVITYDMLMYNRGNFRDIYSGKPKGITRQQHKLSDIAVNEGYLRYQVSKAKRFVRNYNVCYNHGKSELENKNEHNEQATQIHHIFPEAQFPIIAAYCENLIALTPTQHMNHAHPKGKTFDIDLTYQHLCLLAKVANIEKNICDDKQAKIYDYDNLIFVLQNGFNDKSFCLINNVDFISIINKINLHYQVYS